MIKKIIIILIFVFASIILSICIGSIFISPKEIISIFFYKIFYPNLIENKINADIIFNIRLPRSILAFFVGASLSLTGVVVQSILRNPLASAYNLGISSGAGLGAALLIITGIYFNQYVFVAVSTIFAFITIIFILFISNRIDKYMNNNSIILAGIVISLFLYSLMSFFIYIFPKRSNQIILWQLGNLYLKNFADIFIIIFITLIFLLVLIKYSTVLDIMTFGDDTSLSLGVDAKKMRIFFIIIASFITAVLVSFVGIIGFVDLVSPHIARKIFKANHIIVLPMSALFGGILLNVADIFSRIIISGANIPIGIVTALIGAPFFLYIFIIGRNNKL
ncbi:iron ABC transporter permease [uncultured Brachyspira sp.]|jgi:iron complex transport system permease protein|uniref:FecCD family ABC transporter permease n=1 Tax=uncultured Brachyspira sp. TaxID=221953 RepID=UPI002584A429|nr:iron ABC transporter permease [uncultured Brachyspira sp.]